MLGVLSSLTNQKEKKNIRENAMDNSNAHRDYIVFTIEVFVRNLKRLI